MMKKILEEYNNNSNNNNMHKPESFPKNEILWDFEIQTNYLIRFRRPSEWK